MITQPVTSIKPQEKSNNGTKIGAAYGTAAGAGFTTGIVHQHGKEVFKRINQGIEDGRLVDNPNFTGKWTDLFTVSVKRNPEPGKLGLGKLSTQGTLKRLGKIGAIIVAFAITGAAIGKLADIHNNKKAEKEYII